MTLRHVAIRVDMLSSFGRGIVAGISRYSRTRANWVFWGDPERIASPIEDLQRWHGDGVIAQVWQEDILDRLLAWGRPFVNVSHHLPRPIPASILADSEAIGRLAAEHLLQRGFRSFAYVGFEGHRYSEIRGRAFHAAVEAQGGACRDFIGPAPQIDPQRWSTFHAELTAWLRALPRPAGVFCCNDVRARHVAQACHDGGVRVPEDLAIIGVDNDELLCEMSNPPLSSVDAAPELIGYEAARLLDELMSGRVDRLPAEPRLIPPAGVITRRSSDVLAIDDEIVAQAVRFIHERVPQGPLGVDDVVAAVPASRRVLERRFRASLDRTVGQEIDNARLARAKHLLVHGDDRILDVARRSGFNHVQQFNRLFRQATGMTPAEFRRQSKPR